MRIAVPMMQDTPDALLRQAQAIAAHPGADMAEWRADALGAALTAAAAAALIPELLRALAGKPLIFTLRTEGGAARTDTAQLLLAAARCGVPWLDVEALHCPDAAGVIAALHALGSRVIASHHDFAATPSLPELLCQAEALRQSGADIVKLAVTAHNEQDVQTAHALCRQLRAQGTAYAVIPMGEAGRAGRLQAQRWGCALTFCHLGAPSAPGQVTVEQMLHAAWQDRA